MSAEKDVADIFFDTLSRLRTMAEKWFTSSELFTQTENEARMDSIDEFFEAGRLCEFTPNQLVALVFSDIPNLGGTS